MKWKEEQKELVFGGGENKGKDDNEFVVFVHIFRT